ncbi:MAG: CheR family methyltransferase [Psychroflexus sp.]
MKKISSKDEKAKFKNKKDSNFPIVAIGSSAGGLEAVTELLVNLPPNLGMAFIYVQHLSPDHKSKLTDIFSSKTKMEVQEIKDMDEIKANTFFVMPSNMGVEVKDSHINLVTRSKSSTAVSIDNLFSSLAHAQKERVIGIILSGTASDGTAGIKTIKEEGGLTFAQDQTAKFDSMPKSAIETGIIDFVLSPKEIANKLLHLSENPLIESLTASPDIKGFDESLEKNNPELKAVINELVNASGVDFNLYKINTIVRRIYRRMLLNKIDTLKDYLKFISKNENEVDILYKDLLINVTSFFREPETYDYLKKEVFPNLLRRKKANDYLRVWIPACSTGEEAYSIAMILYEIQEEQNINRPVQIFATDLSRNAIEKARVGIYNREELENLTSQRIERFFTKTDGSYRINKDVRSMCVFAHHNILRDPPFSRLDFVSCCNLFIYFETIAQKKATNIFHHALNDDGFLMIGKSESISHSAKLFKDYKKEFRIFVRKSGSIPRQLPELSPRFAQKELPADNISKAKNRKKKSNYSIHDNGLETAIDRLLISEFMPASVVINNQMEIVQFRGDTDIFFSHPKGKATFNILRIARPEIAFELRTAIPKVISTNERFSKGGIVITTKSSEKIISLEIVPLDIERDEPLLLILFNDQGEIATSSQDRRADVTNTPSKDRQIKKLEKELTLAKADALSTLEEQEAFTQRLQSAHEEVLSTNEELQTVNEELETSKEELESANEELTVTIQELQTRNELLHESYEYSDAIVNTMHDPLLVLNKDLRIKSANDAFYEKFKTEEKDTEGKLLFNLGNKQWDIPALRELLENIIPKNTQFFDFEVKQEFLNLGERIMSVNAKQIIQKTHHEQLILLIISDITEVRQLLVEKELRERELLNKELNIRKEEKIRLKKAVEERTHQLKEAKDLMEVKNASLVNANKELEAFAYVASHDLQEPLRMIKSFMDQLVRRYGDQLDPKAHQYIHYATDGAERMKQIIMDLLQYSKAGSAHGGIEEVDLNEVVEEFKRLRRRLIKEKKAEINSDPLPEIKIHKAFVKQVFHGLLDNAIKYSKENVPPLVNISVHDKNGIWEFHIEDNGIGIDRKFHKKIFMIFQRLHNKDQYEGTGIGLSIAKKLIESLGGEIWLTSVPGKGSTFCFTLPKSKN